MNSKKLITLFLLIVVAAGLVFFKSQFVFGGIDCLCDYAHIYEEYEFICPTGYNFQSVAPYDGYCQGTTCVKTYQIICEGDAIEYDIIKARIVLAQEWIPNCCGLDQFE